LIPVASDYNLKENIYELNEQNDYFDFDNIHVYQYNLKSDEGKRKLVGIVAQDLRDKLCSGKKV
jgi:Chaperone of endosialidase